MAHLSAHQQTSTMMVSQVSVLASERVQRWVLEVDTLLSVVFVMEELDFMIESTGEKADSVREGP